MAFESIQNVDSGSTSVPADGLVVTPRKLGKRNSDGQTRYIHIQFGAELSKALALRLEVVGLDVAFGTDRDAGKIRVSVDIESGQFEARRDKQGRYAFTIREGAGAGIFSFDFAKFTIPSVDVRAETGKPPYIIFEASKDMLAET